MLQPVTGIVHPYAPLRHRCQITEFRKHCRLVLPVVISACHLDHPEIDSIDIGISQHGHIAFSGYKVPVLRNGNLPSLYLRQNPEAFERPFTLRPFLLGMGTDIVRRLLKSHLTCRVVGESGYLVLYHLCRQGIEHGTELDLLLIALAQCHRPIYPYIKIFLKYLITVRCQIIGKQAHPSQIYSRSDGGLRAHVMESQTLHHIQFPKISVIRSEALHCLEEIIGTTIETAVIQERTFAFHEIPAGHGSYGIIHQQVHQQGTQLESILVPSGEEFLVIT